MLTLIKYAIRIVLQVFALTGLTVIYTLETLTNTAFSSEGNFSDLCVLAVAGTILGLIAMQVLLHI